jgi:hypothetical protein
LWQRLYFRPLPHQQASLDLRLAGLTPIDTAPV